MLIKTAEDANGIISVSSNEGSLANVKNTC